MKGDQMGTLTAHPSLQELSLSNQTRFSVIAPRKLSPAPTVLRAWTSGARRRRDPCWVVNRAPACPIVVARSSTVPDRTSLPAAASWSPGLGSDGPTAL